MIGIDLGNEARENDTQPSGVALLHIALRLATIPLLLSTVLFLAACQSPTQDPSSTEVLPVSPTAAIQSPVVPAAPSEEPLSNLRGEVTIWMSWEPEAVAVLNQSVEKFLETHPFVTFRINYIPPQEMRDRLETAFELGTAPAVFIAPTTWSYAFHEQGRLRDVSGWLIPQYELELNPLALESVFEGTSYFGVPLQLEGIVLYRNRDLAPMPPATLSEMVESAKGIRAGEIEGAFLDFTYLQSGSQMKVCGDIFFDEGWIEAFAGETGQCWLRLLRAWSAAGPVQFDSDEDLDAFTAGQVGWILESTSNLESLLTLLGDTNLAIDPWPVYEEKNSRLAGYVWSEAAHFSASTSEEEFDASMAFILSLLSSETQLTLSGERGGNQIPVRAGIEPTSGLMAQLLTAINQGTALPHGLMHFWSIEVYERAARAVSVQGTAVELAHLRAIDELTKVLETLATPENGDE